MTQHTADTINDDALDELYARLKAMEAAVQSTAADALAHRGCHRDLMAQCQRAERAEADRASETARADRAEQLATELRKHAEQAKAAMDRLRADLAEEMRKHNNTIAVAAGRTVDAEQAEAAIARARALADQWAILRSHGSAAAELRAALTGQQQEAGR